MNVLTSWNRYEAPRFHSSLLYLSSRSNFLPSPTPTRMNTELGNFFQHFQLNDLHRKTAQIN